MVEICGGQWGETELAVSDARWRGNKAMALSKTLFLGATCLLLACTAFAAESTEESQRSASLLIPQTEADYSNFITTLMDSQHKMLSQIHGVDSPQVALSSTLLDLQGSIAGLMTNLTAEYTNFLNFLTTAPSAFNVFKNDASLLNAQLNATIAAVSPNAAKLITLGTPAYVQNAPFTIGATTTGIGASEQLFNVGPCLITFAEQGININPLLIQISPRLIQNDAIGIQIQPELITVDPTLINIGPNGLNASPTNVQASPLFINVSPTVKVIPNSNKVPTYAANIAIKPNPDPPTVTNEFGKVVAQAPPAPGSFSGKH
ncbi:g13203 [Coccomyxa viridis]|uniref:G13203 protein n=1 Tax=Coccomyxa viridis TaxID=1274662 RepID=A0ABP1GC81_9CHLO